MNHTRIVCPLRFSLLSSISVWIWRADCGSGADCGSDHELLIAKFRLKLKKVGTTTRPFRYDLNQLPYSYTVEVTSRFKGLDLIECLKNSIKFCLKSGFSSTRTMDFQMFKLDLEKAEEPEIKLTTSSGSLKKQESSRKPSTSALLTMPKPLTVWITTHCGKFYKRWEYQTTWPASWEICMQVRKQQLELDMEQQTGSK